MWKFIRNVDHINFFRLWWAQLISQFGDRVHQMALIGLIAERTPGSAWELAKLLSFTIIPVFIIGPIAGVYVDRWDRRRTLFVCDFLRGLLVLSIPFVFIYRESMLPIYVVVFFAFCLSRFYVPAKMSIVPDLVDDKNLLTANSLLTTTGMLAFVLGCAMGGFLVDLFGAQGGFIIDSVTFFVSGLLVFSIPSPLKLTLNKAKISRAGQEVIGILKKSLMTEIREGLQYLIAHKEIRFIISMLFTLFAAAGAIYIVIIVFIQQSFQSVTKDLGILAVLLGMGLFGGVLVHGRYGKEMAWYKTTFICLILGGWALILFALIVHRYPNIILAGLLSLLLGLISGPIFIAANTVAQQVCKENMRGKVFSALEVVIHFAFLAAMFVSSILSEYFASVWILSGVGLTITSVGLVGLIGFKEGLATTTKKRHN